MPETVHVGAQGSLALSLQGGLFAGEGKQGLEFAIGGGAKAGLGYYAGASKTVYDGYNLNPYEHYTKAKELEQWAEAQEDIDPYAHEKAAWEYGNYVGNPFVAAIERSASEFIYQFPMYTYQDLYSRYKTGEKGKYQPYLWNAPGGIRDSFYDIKNTIQGANGVPLDFMRDSSFEVEYLLASMRYDANSCMASPVK